MRELELLRRRYGGHMPTLLGARHEYTVLCPLLEQPDGLHFLFEVRASAIRQAGETCFPGGRMEPGESPTVCALRETMEELAIPPSEIQILGRGDFICNQRGFLLRPVLGLVSAAGIAALHLAPAEVAEVFTVPLAFFRATPPGALQLRVDSQCAEGLSLRDRGHPPELSVGPRQGRGPGLDV